MSEQTFGDSTGASDATGAGPGGAAVAHVQPLDVAEFAEGQPAPYSVYVVHGFYEDVIDLDGSTVNIERSYPKDRYVTQIAPGERGNLVVHEGSEVTAEVLALISAG